MRSSKGNKMIPEWFLQILGLLFGILGGGAVWYFISQQQYYHALWSGFTAALILLVCVTLFIRNDIIKREFRSKIPVYFGELVPSNDESPPLPSNVPKDTITLMLGDNLRLLAAQSQNFIFSLGANSFLSIGIKDKLMFISASIVDSNNHNIVRIINNEFQASPERAFNPRQPDKHSIVVRDSQGMEVLNIRFLNPKAMRIVGRFHILGYTEPVVILPNEGIRWPGGGGISHLTINLTQSKGGLLKF